ncbi:MAG: hypothetical protein KDD50_03655 [Bdellovibrionales bacterium]|nr:hypothetical protein [Bdellovibrionales bacterium]
MQKPEKPLHNITFEKALETHTEENENTPEDQEMPPKDLVESLDLAKPFKSQQKWVKYEVKEGWAVSQGDILLGRPKPEDKSKVGRVQSAKTRLWSGGVIPFAIQQDTPNRAEILKVLEFFNSKTVIKFVEFEGDEDVLVFVPSQDLCGSYLGRVGGQQPVLISRKCGFQEIAHEVMHALGFVHEQSRSDRDKSIEVLWDNIEDFALEQFAIAPKPWLDEMKYDSFYFSYHTIMLYSERAFAKKSGLLTLRSRTQETISPADRPTDEDIYRIDMVYSNAK